MIVSAFTSTIELPMPEHREADRRRPPTTGRPPIRASGSPNSTRPKREVGGEPARVASTSATKPPTRPPTPERGVQVADTRLVEVEQLERGDDDEDVQRAGDERLRACRGRRACGGSGSPTIVAMPARTPSARCSSAACAARGRRAAPRAAQAEHEQRRPEERQRRSPRTRSRRCETASRSPPSAGPTKVPTLSSVLDATFAAVSSAGVRDERREQRRLRRAEHRSDDAS